MVEREFGCWAQGSRGSTWLHVGYGEALSRMISTSNVSRGFGAEHCWAMERGAVSNGAAPRGTVGEWLKESRRGSPDPDPGITRHNWARSEIGACPPNPSLRFPSQTIPSCPHRNGNNQNQDRRIHLLNSASCSGRIDPQARSIPQWPSSPPPYPCHPAVAAPFPHATSTKQPSFLVASTPASPPVASPSPLACLKWSAHSSP